MNRKPFILISSSAVIITFIIIMILVVLAKKNNTGGTDNSGLASVYTSEPVAKAETKQEMSKPVINSNMKYVLQTYYVNSDKAEHLSEQEYQMPSEFITLDKDELQEYLNNYMDDLPIREYLDGLISYEIIEFTDDSLTLRKTYASDWNNNEFYLCDINGEVVVYYSDKSTVYEYTGIMTADLSEEEQVRIKTGYFVADEEELYSLLESYSS